MIRTIIVDDEQHCIDRLNKQISEFLPGVVHVMDSFTSVADATRAIEQYQPELVFMDVQLGNDTGFDVLKKLDSINFEVIFTTAYEKYAVKAFKFSALDYLLKPVDEDELVAAVNKLLQKVSKIDASRKIETLLGNLYSASKRICVPVMNGMIILKVDEIIRCESDINYTTIFLKDKQKIVVAKTLKEFDEMLTDYNFFRVHNSHLVNLACIKSYNKGKGGSVVMSDNTELEVSTRRKDDFLKRLLTL
ncbi:MAG: response regulator transcription factor [Niastella sp.]|nr:response regulator transcription factor [Niastella sp.]